MAAVRFFGSAVLAALLIAPVAACSSASGTRPGHEWTIASGVASPSASSAVGCSPGGPPSGAATRDIGRIDGRPATLWVTDLSVGISTDQGTAEAPIHSASPLPRRALFIDAQQNGAHQIIVDTGREAHLYSVSGCTITTIVDGRGAPFIFDLEHRRGTGDGVGCSDLGGGRRLVGLLRQQQDNGRRTVRRTEIELSGATAVIGNSDSVPAASDQDPAWASAGTISCGQLTIDRDGLVAGS